MKSRVIKSILFVFIIFQCSGLHATSYVEKDDEAPLTRILFVFDASQSMLAMWETEQRITIAKELLINLVDSLQHNPNVQMALRVFGHQSHHTPQDCTDTNLEVGFWTGNAYTIKQKVRQITPRGTTLIAKSLEEAEGDFPDCEDCRNIIILITDGIERCGGDPCEVSQRLQRKGIFLRPFVIGIGRDFSEEYDCVGYYFDAMSENQFKKSLNIVISQALEATSLQVNLLDVYGNPTETNIPITFYNSETGKVEDNIVHTMNHRGQPDTLYNLNTTTVYDMEVHTLPPVKVENIRITPGIHNTIAADVPQGSIEVVVGGRTPYNFTVIARKSGLMESLNIQNSGEQVKYLVGKYDLEVLSLPRLIIEEVEVEQNHITTVELPQPGIAAIRLPARGFGSVFKETDDGLKLVYRLKENVKNETISLMPGNYRVVYRSRASRATFYTIDKTFVIEPGISKTVIVN